MYLTVNNYNKTYCLFGGFYEKLKQVFKNNWTTFTSYSY